MTAIVISVFLVKCCVSFNSTASQHTDNHQTELCIVTSLNCLNKLSQNFFKGWSVQRFQTITTISYATQPNTLISDFLIKEHN